MRKLQSLSIRLMLTNGSRKCSRNFKMKVDKAKSKGSKLFKPECNLLSQEVTQLNKERNGLLSTSMTINQF